MSQRLQPLIMRSDYPSSEKIPAMLDQLKKITNKLTLVLDNSQSVRTQGRQLVLAQKELNILKKRLSNEIRAINANPSDKNYTIPLDIADIFNQPRRNIKTTKQALKQPLTEIKLYIDTLDLKAERLKLIAKGYLENPRNPQHKTDLQRELADIPIMPTFHLKHQGIQWGWVASIICLIAAVAGIVDLSLWTMLAAPFWTIAGLALLPPLQPTIRDRIESQNIPIPYPVIRTTAIAISVAIGILFLNLDPELNPSDTPQANPRPTTIAQSPIIAPDLSLVNNLIEKIYTEFGYRPNMTTWGGTPTLLISDTAWSSLSPDNKKLLIDYAEFMGNGTWQIIAGRIKDSATIYIDEEVCNSYMLAGNEC